MTRRKPKSAAKPTPTPVVLVDATPAVVEVWGDPSWSIRDRDRRGPTCFNGISIRRYRVTVEVIDESIDVLRERLTTLWLTSERNHHRWDGFQQAAKELGMPPFDLNTMGSQLAKVTR